MHHPLPTVFAALVVQPTVLFVSQNSEALVIFGLGEPPHLPPFHILGPASPIVQWLREVGVDLHEALLQNLI